MHWEGCPRSGGGRDGLGLRSIEARRTCRPSRSCRGGERSQGARSPTNLRTPLLFEALERLALQLKLTLMAKLLWFFLELAPFGTLAKVNSPW